MRTALRIITTLMGVFFTLQGVGWIVAPQRAAVNLGMPVLDGLARSTQFGDFAAFFLVLGLGVLAGSVGGGARRLYFPAALLIGASVCRTIAWAAHGADFAGAFIGVELVSGIVLLVAARQGGAEVTRDLLG